MGEGTRKPVDEEVLIAASDQVVADFKADDMVGWIGDDEDLPRGGTGSVVCTNPDGKVCVRVRANQVLIFRPEELFVMDKLPASFAVTFQPGRIGIVAEFQGSGLVQRIEPESQAYKAGVQVGMCFKEVNGQPYTEELLVQHIKGGSEYVVVFGNSPLSCGAASEDSAPKLRPGQKVILSGLQSRPELNGKRATLVKYVEEKGRWEVIIDGSHKLFKADNLEAEGAVKRGFLHKTMDKEEREVEQKQEEDADDMVIWLAAATLVGAAALGAFYYFQRQRRLS
eukprot:TRINITY_DN17732_c1_g2_i1.p1 TRINITY_DN17732_c1_g2~~TRINITY_DN17732_c1_g2_i1.p1  ORF type:complete len:297 (-),score=52.77 TRINITY_DN17732_c1_g2_i1:161-1006(-)